MNENLDMKTNIFSYFLEYVGKILWYMLGTMYFSLFWQPWTIFINVGHGSNNWEASIPFISYPSLVGMMVESVGMMVESVLAMMINLVGIMTRTGLMQNMIRKKGQKSDVINVQSLFFE